MGQSASSQELFLNTMKDVDLDKFSGRWHEVGRLPIFWERNCKGAIAEYSHKPGSKKLRVKNTCFNDNGSIHSRYADAWSDDPEFPGVLSISFEGAPSFGKGYYLLFHTDYNNFAVVGSPNYKYFWILSRHRRLDNKRYMQAYKLGLDLGYNMNRLEIMQ